MKKLRSLLLVLPVSLLVAATAAPVFAKAGDGSGGGTSHSGGSDDNMTEQQKQALKQVREALKHRIENATKDQKDAQESTELEFENENNTRADEILSELMHSHRHHTRGERKHNCQAAKQGLERKLTNLQTKAANFQSRIDSVLVKALDYQATSGLIPTGFTDLVNTANTAKADAAAAVATLQALSVNLNCDSPTVATNVATFKAAAEQTRTSLKAYKTAVKNILIALKTASEGGDQ